MSIYDITPPEGCTNLDGFDIKPFGELHQFDPRRIRITDDQKSDELRRAYRAQIVDILAGSLAPFVKKVQVRDLFQVIIDVSPEGIVKEFNIADLHFWAGTSSPVLNNSQLFDIVRLFHITSSISILRKPEPHLFHELNEQRNNICAALGGVICTSHNVQFESTIQGKLITSIYREDDKVRNITGRYWSPDENFGTFFPRIINPVQINALEQSVVKIVKAAKPILGPQANLNTILAHFEAHPDGNDGSLAIRQNQFRTRQIRSNSL